ncbi:LysR substrate-binding domain-containing protein [Thalassotalea sp. 1_MG-2023]|uniref:LysR family transcriptional regulator n=1 Tax=Thalassotalea sp. 1_MG-2023 TaxID=3062680 RepID=UPI0026E3C4CB|nr:LysR family transcriptional regulator [Thalassotalea sp. 1_MG-2023]MDO6428259.1 LysR substrate-binding domain-containing protein [Thalassotalea sp. 1_MG-2023]
MDKFRAMTLFATTTKTENFTETAKLHATDPSTVSKAIKRLEEQLGLQLFNRSTRQLKLTSAGSRYAQMVEELLLKLKAHEEELRQDSRDIKGTLKINLPVSYGRQYVLPMLCEFREAYPQLQLDINFSDEYVDMIKESIDISIRSGTIADNRLVAQKLSPIKFVLCIGSNADITNNIEITQECLSSYPWILFRFKQTGKTMPIDFNYKGKRISLEPTQKTIVDDGEAMAELCAANAGIALMPHFIAKQWVKTNKVKIIATLDESQSVASGVYIIYAKREHLPKRRRVFIDFVKAYLVKLGESPRKTWLD